MDQLTQQQEDAHERDSLIRDFYAHRHVLITGATGFIGKVLIEKLLYSCPELEKIYLLIRASKGRSARERMMDMIEQRPFTMRLKKEFILNKLVAIESDLAVRGLGLSQESEALLLDQVSIVFHVAASVKFEAPLEVNMRHNVVATRDLLEFACRFRRLACFVHVSTAYSNCQLLNIEERVYKMDVPTHPMKLEVTKQMIDNRPNTYTYTKALAENVASQYAGRINVVIVRPSIVMSSLQEPAEGWVDTINGPVGLSVLGALGILQKIKVNSEVVFDLIPVDIVTNAMISIAWATTERRREFVACSVLDKDEPPQSAPEGLGGASEVRESQSNKENLRAAAQDDPVGTVGKSGSPSSQAPTGNGLVQGEDQLAMSSHDQDRNNNVDHNQISNRDSGPDGRVCVFNLTTGSENPCSFYHYFNTGRQEAYKKPSVRTLRPLLHIPKQKRMNPIQYWIHKVFSHLLFAYIMDLLLGLFGQKKMVVKAVNKMHHANEMFDYFCSNQWNFDTNNVKRLRQLQTTRDKSEFNCDVRMIDWTLYARLGWLGCRRYILKESDDSLVYAKRRYSVICFSYYAVKILLMAACYYLVSNLIESQLVLSLMMIPIAGTMYLL